MHKLRNRMITIATNIILIYLGLLLLISIFQAKLIFFPTSEIATTPATYQWDYEEITRNVDGETTHGWFISAPDTSRGTVLFSHGNAGNISDRLESIKIFRDLDFNTLIYDYGGYGKSSGSPSEKRCYADIRSQWEYLTKERQIPEDKIILFGRSLGGGPTAQLATEVDPAAVILESTFASIADMAHGQFPIFPTTLLLKHKFNTIHKVPEITAPVLHIHSSDDTLIPYTHGQKLFEASTQPKQFHDLHGDHNEGYLISKDYPQAVNEFLTRHLPTPEN